MEILTSSSSEWEEELKTAAVFAVLDEENKKSTRSCWVQDINKKISKLGEFHRLVQELPNDPRRFHMYFRMMKEEFDYVHDLIKKDIQKKSTQF
ncbi:unnamed protein product [Macrosiphum euphorbiae]|uniref:Uncharacterized protein n=1 Tax=Macrosiphum euphorbiae TaxID=13131 RepID=A0AAV0WEA4_9HEMI|nr:unnamed protein product [Macrosiphum euphorbiae]